MYRKRKAELTFSFIYFNTAKASAYLRSSPNALISELRANRLGFRPSPFMILKAFTACSDNPYWWREQHFTHVVIRYLEDKECRSLEG